MQPRQNPGFWADIISQGLLKGHRLTMAEKGLLDTAPATESTLRVPIYAVQDANAGHGWQDWSRIRRRAFGMTHASTVVRRRNGRARGVGQALSVTVTSYECLGGSRFVVLDDQGRVEPRYCEYFWLLGGFVGGYRLSRARLVARAW